MTKLQELGEKLFPREPGKVVDAAGQIIDVSDKNSPLRYGFFCGYEQAEKDLALTWKDIKLICEIEDRYWNEEWENNDPKTTQEYYQEVLRRFLESKKAE